MIPLPPEVAVAYKRWCIVIAPDSSSDEAIFMGGFRAGQYFQHQQIKRILCKDCLLDKPLLKDAPIPTHIINEEGQRRTCQARELAAFDPR